MKQKVVRLFFFFLNNNIDKYYVTSDLIAKECFYPHIWNKTTMYALAISSQYYIGSSSLRKYTRNRIKWHSAWKTRSKVICICKWSDLVYRKLKRLHGGSVTYVTYKQVQQVYRMWDNFRKIKYISAAAAAKLLQSCPTLCNPIDGSPPGSTVPGIL